MWGSDVQRRYSYHNVYLRNRQEFISHRAASCPVDVCRATAHPRSGSVLLIWSLYSGMFTPFLGTTRTLVSLYRIHQKYTS